MTKGKKPTPIMVMGTRGNLDYLAFARKGDIALSVKPNQIKSGAAFGAAGTVWIGARLRAAEAPDQLPELPVTAPSNVVQFDKDQTLPGSPWTAVTWEKQHPLRCSTTIGGLFPGSMDSTADCLKLVADLESGAVATKMAEYLVQMAEGGDLFLTVEQLAEQLQDAYFAKIAADSRKALEVQQKVNDSMKSSIGSFGMQAQLLKAAYKETEPSDVPDVEDASDNEG